MVKYLAIVGILGITTLFCGTAYGSSSSVGGPLDLKSTPAINELAVNQAGKVTLMDNSGSTGYEWHYCVSNPEVMKLESIQDMNHPAPGQQTPIGAPIEKVWNFKAVKEGECRITFKKYRAWEGESQSVETLEYLIKVQE